MLSYVTTMLRSCCQLYLLNLLTLQLIITTSEPAVMKVVFVFLGWFITINEVLSVLGVLICIKLVYVRIWGSW